ncbi:DNA dC-, partial [Paramuricea clavata]
MAQAAKKLWKNDIVKFIIPLQYHQRGWPTGKGSVIVLSKVKIYYAKSRIELLSDIHRYQGEKIHSEIDFLKKLRDKIEKEKGAGRQMERIEADLVQNYSPCSECADVFVKFKDFRKREGIKFSLKIEFANFYRHWETPYINGLKRLLENGVALKLLHGEDDWRAFLNDKTFVELTEHEKAKLLDRANSEDRKKNEKQAIKIFNNIRLGNDIAGLGNTSQPSG